MAATCPSSAHAPTATSTPAGFGCADGFVVTVGNTVNNAGAVATSQRRQRLVTDHEDVHVWQGRWFGPLYPVLYVGWTVVGGLGRRADLAHRGAATRRCSSVAETCGYYLNPFEWWAYSRDGGWPPPGQGGADRPSRPLVAPFSVRRRARRSAASSARLNSSGASCWVQWPAPSISVVPRWSGSVTHHRLDVARAGRR